MRPTLLFLTLAATLVGNAPVPAQAQRPPQTMTAHSVHAPPALPGEITLDRILGRDVAPAATVTDELGDLLTNNAGRDACGVPSNVWEQFPEFLSPLAGGSFVNFESPQVRPLALSADGTKLFATNTPNNSLVVLSTAGALTVVGEIPVGLDPVSVAVQPGTGYAWVVNHISDNISVVDPATSSVVEVIEVGDEPVSLIFDPTGAWAFVVIQGIAADADLSDPTNVEEGNLVVIDAATRQVISRTYLDMNTPRALVFDPASNRVIVAALYSGNNTTVVGEPVALHTPGIPEDPPPNSCNAMCNCICEFKVSLEILRDFSVTAQGFADNLAPWPDVHDDPDLSATAPFVQRIVQDAGVAGAWQSVISLLVDADGVPLPAVVTSLNGEFGITNGEEVIQHIVDDAKDTLDHDLVVLDASNPASAAGLPILWHTPNVGTTLTAMARHPSDGHLFVANMQPHNTTRLTLNLKGNIVDHEIVKVSDPTNTGPFVRYNLHAAVSNFDSTTPDNIEAQENSLANPIDIVFHPTEDVAFMAALGPGRVGSLNATTAAVLDRVDVGRGPRGLALNANTQRLYVMNRTDLTIAVIDVSDPSNMQVEETVPLFNPEPEVIKNGRDFLYSTRVSHNYASSCATCHIDGHLDHLAWDLGDVSGGLQPPPPPLHQLNNHPLKGPMVTMSLRGLRNHEPFHWRGDKPTFQDFNEAFENLLGGSQLPPGDMDAFTDFIHTVVYPPNPFYARDNTFKDESRALCGIVPYITNCQACHRLEHGGAMPGSAADPPEEDDLGGNFSGPPLFAQLQVVTQMRGLHKKFHSDRFGGAGLIHDGREERNDNDHPLQTFLFQFFPNIDAQGQLDMISFVNAFPTNVMPVVGWQVLVAAVDGAVQAAAVESDVLMMIAQHDKIPSHADVVARGAVNGQPHGYYYNANGMFESDTGEEISLQALLGRLAGDDWLTFTAVPPGSGKRIGIDQDTDCLPNGMDNQPQLSNAGDVNFDGAVNLTDFHQLVTCYALDGPLPADCLLFDNDCNGILDEIDANAFVGLFEGPVLDCNGNGQADLLDILLAGTPDINEDGVPDECNVETPLLAPPPHDILKIRYVSIDPRGAFGLNVGKALDIQLTLVSTLVNGVTAIGSQWWTGAPDADCISVVGPNRPATPPNWDACPTLHLTGCPIIPTSTYDIVMMDAATLSPPLSGAATQAKPGTKWHGDAVGSFDGTAWTPPQGIVNIDDAVAAIKTFQNPNGINATHVSVTDVHPNQSGRQINKVVNFDDVFVQTLGFQGDEYPGEDLTLCPDA